MRPAWRLGGAWAALLATGALVAPVGAFPGMGRPPGSAAPAGAASAAGAAFAVGSGSPASSASAAGSPASSASAAGGPGTAPTAPAAPSAGSEPQEPPRDAIAPRDDLPAGTIALELRSGQSQPLPGRAVTVELTRETVAEGIHRERRELTTDALGRARVNGLPTDTSHRYRVVTREGPAEYATQEFPLDRRRGQGVVLHAYPWSEDLSQVLVGFRAMVYLQPRDDVFQVEVMLTLHNVGAVTWVPRGVSFELPPGAKAFTTDEGAAAFRAVDRTVSLSGTYAPGSRDIGFRFQLPNDGEASAEWTLELPPHVAELRVASEASRDMTLEVRARSRQGGLPLAFPEAEVTRSAKGDRVLITGRGLKPGEPELAAITLGVAGLPTRGEGRLTAALLALGVAALGAAAVRAGATRRLDDLARARRVLEAEVLRLDAALAAGGIGPETHAQARARLVEALVRLEARLGEPAPAQARPRRQARPS